MLAKYVSLSIQLSDSLVWLFGRPNSVHWYPTISLVGVIRRALFPHSRKAPRASDEHASSKVGPSRTSWIQRELLVSALESAQRVNAHSAKDNAQSKEEPLPKLEGQSVSLQLCEVSYDKFGSSFRSVILSHRMYSVALLGLSWR